MQVFGTACRFHANLMNATLALRKKPWPGRLSSPRDKGKARRRERTSVAYGCHSAWTRDDLLAPFPRALIAPPWLSFLLSCPHLRLECLALLSSSFRLNEPSVATQHHVACAFLFTCIALWLPLPFGGLTTVRRLRCRRYVESVFPGEAFYVRFYLRRSLQARHQHGKERCRAERGPAFGRGRILPRRACCGKQHEPSKWTLLGTHRKQNCEREKCGFSNRSIRGSNLSRVTFQGRLERAMLKQCQFLFSSNVHFMKPMPI